MTDPFNTPNYVENFEKFRQLSKRATLETKEFLMGLPEAGGMNKLVLDACAGTGRFTKIIIDAFPHARIHAIDQSPYMIEKMLNDPKLSRLELISKVSVEEFSEGNLRYDLVCASSAIHLFDLNIFFRSVLQLLKPNGLLIVRTSTVEDLHICNPLGAIKKANLLEKTRAHSRDDILRRASLTFKTTLVQEIQITSVRYYKSQQYKDLLESKAKSVLYSLSETDITKYISIVELQGLKRHKLTSTNSIFVFQRIE